MDLFKVCETQWRRAGLDGRPIGLDYAGVKAAAEMMALRISRETFCQLQIVEAGAVSELRYRWGAE